MRLGKRIRAFRRRYRVTQEEFAEMIGTTRATINAWENERTKPKQTAILERIQEVVEGGNPVLVKKTR